MKFSYKLPNTDQFLEVEFGYESATGDGRDEPYCAAYTYIESVKFLTVDMTDMLNEETMATIEQAALRVMEDLDDDHL